MSTAQDNCYILLTLKLEVQNNNNNNKSILICIPWIAKHIYRLKLIGFHRKKQREQYFLIKFSSFDKSIQWLICALTKPKFVQSSMLLKLVGILEILHCLFAEISDWISGKWTNDRSYNTYQNLESNMMNRNWKFVVKIDTTQHF